MTRSPWFLLAEVTRSKFRQNQRRWLASASGDHLLLLTAEKPEDEKVVMDRRYFEELASLVSTYKISRVLTE